MRVWQWPIAFGLRGSNVALLSDDSCPTIVPDTGTRALNDEVGLWPIGHRLGTMQAS
jgi:hypothetical protein